MRSGSGSDKESFFSSLGKIKPRAALGLALLGVLLMLASSLFTPKESTDTVGDTEEVMIADACSRITGAGECDAFIRYGKDGEVLAVIIDCEASDTATRAEIRRLVADFFGIGINRVSVI
ncbi:MAG: hypothetical protein IKV20_02050 [Clostridia bacterium]|nr:hypothetical protein [Clostridia bacterium]